jgi:sigma-B regulation protein RsbU (phosphoserine phosphatase)
MENIRAAMSRGASDVVTKPVDFDDFKMTISRTLEQLNTLRGALEVRSKFIAISRELDVASKLQQAILPKVFIDQKQVQLHGIMRPATEVGGDFYDFFWLDKNRLGVVMADVSGKGITAALFMAISRTHLKAIAPYANSPKECLINLNNELSKDNETAMFVTTFYGVINIKTGEFVYSNGGHCLPVLIDAKGKAIYMKTTAGMGVGIVDNIDFGDKKIKLTSGDSVFLYTDGVTEAMNPKYEEFTGERLLKSLAKTHKLSMSDMINKVVKDVDSFADGASQSDDITCLSFRYRGK